MIKISELTPKGANLQNSDLLEVSVTTADGYESKSITGAEIITAAQSGLQPTLVSGTNIKTINGNSLLGSGDLSITTSASWGSITGTLSSQTDLQSALNGKQATLVSGTNIKTINGNSLLGSGDITISGSNIYTADGTLTGARTLTLGGVALTIAGTTSSRFQANGNVGIGTTTDAGFKLDVNGTARVQGQITTTTADAQFGTLGASTGVFRIDGVNGSGYAFSVYSSSTLRFAVVGFGGVLMPNGFTIVTGSTDFTTTRLRIGTGNITGAINIQAQSGNTDIVSFKASNGGDQFTIKNTSGNVLIGTSTDIASSKVTIQSTTQGFLPPRMTTSQVNAIATPAEGLVVYNTTISHLCVYQSGAWVRISHSPM
jgi:hypothetical protein